jgi:hypothetical protein
MINLQRTRKVVIRQPHTLQDNCCVWSLDGAGAVSYNHSTMNLVQVKFYLYISQEHQFLYGVQTFEEELMCNVHGWDKIKWVLYVYCIVAIWYIFHTYEIETE